MTQVPTNRTAASSIEEHTSDHNIFAAQHNELDGHAADTAAHDVAATIAAAIAALIDTAPGTLDTLNELAAALGDDANFASTMTTALSGKAAASHSHLTADLPATLATDAEVAAAVDAHEVDAAAHSGTYVPVADLTAHLADTSTHGFANGAALLDETAHDALDHTGLTGVGGSSTAPGEYGDGSDGVIDFDGSTTVLGLAPSSGVYTLTRDIFLASGSQVSGTAVIKLANFRIFCKGTFTIGASATVHNDGNAASGTSGGAVSAAGTILANAVGGSGVAGASGGGGASPANGLGAASGAGGAAVGGPGIGGGNGSQTVTVPIAAASRPRTLLHTHFVALTTLVRWGGGASGPGGNAAASSTGGGGGAGGNVVEIYVYDLVVSGLIRSAGGAGGAATGAGSGAGGGGGGGGGALILVYRTKSGAGSTFTAATNAPGGAGGAPQGAGKTGGDGSNGNIYELVH